MVNIKEEAFVSFLLNAKEKAIQTNQRQLISFTKEIKKVNLLDLYAKYEMTSEIDKMFWSNQDDLSILGLDKLYSIVRHDDAFNESELEWQKIKADAHVYNPYQLPGTGVVLMGGLAFDVKQKKQSLWQAFPNSKLSIPTYMVTQSQGRYFMTVNQFIDEDIILREVMDVMTEFESDIIDVDKSQKNQHKVLNKEAIKSDAWKELVNEAVAEIRSERAKKIVLARELRLKLDRKVSIHSVLRNLFETQPNSYIFTYEEADDCFIGATPERLVQIKGKQLLSTCLAGTMPRGKTAEEDKNLAKLLLNDAKNLEEHDYVVQMIRQNIADYCEDIDMPEQPVIYPLRNLQHLYTPVKARLKKGASVLSIINQLHPTPALGGVPREKALSFIRQHEFLERGWYGAPLGWMDNNDNSEFVVAIRSGLIQGKEASLFAGCGVMKDSDAEMEYEETKVKFLPMLNVLED